MWAGRLWWRPNLRRPGDGECSHGPGRTVWGMGYISIDAADSPAEAYFAAPGEGAAPGVILYMDALGMRAQIGEMCERIAGWGYAVLAPNLFYREGTVAELAPREDMRTPEGRDAVIQVARPRIGRLTAERSAHDSDAYVRALEQLGEVRSGPVATVGFCMGARHAMYAAGRHPGTVALTAGFHGGGLVTDDADSPHRSIAGATAAFLFGHADNDPGMTPDNAATLDRALDDAGLEYQSAVYPGATHGYTMADTAMYDERSAERAFAELEEALRRHLPA